MRQWRTDPASGLVEVDGQIPTLTGAAAEVFDAKVRRWQTIACEASHDFAVPVHWILGTIYGESGGFPDARSPKGALGLMQLSSSSARGSLTDEQLKDPRTNVQAGARFINRIWNDGDELPQVASKYNAGSETNGQPHASSSSPWGIREEAGYIDRVVAGANYARDTFTGDCEVRAFPTKLQTVPPIVAPSSPTSPASPVSGIVIAGTGASSSLAGVAFGLGLAFWLWPRKSTLRRARR